MSQESIVYGCIRDASRHRDVVERQYCNRQVIFSLPKDDEWPFLSQDMFALSHFDASQTNGFQSPIIHFGAAYRAIEYEWDEWIIHFENLLNRMYWVSATVHLETELFGMHAFSWQLPDGAAPGAQPHCLRCRWVQEFVKL
ncbi:MAG: hypothetical protein KTR17_05615 [Cellvibrionaceae bacterium]|nr:hypothetical protein [Cellvibrionaceae bacterium]